MHETFLGLNIHAWIALAFAVFVLALLRVGAFRLIGKWLDGQAEKVRNELAEAASLKAEAEEMKANAVKTAAEAEASARALLADAEEEAQRILEKAEVEANAQIERHEQLVSARILSEKRGAEADLRRYAADLTVRAAQGILEERARAGNLDGLTDSAIAAIGVR